MTEAQWEEAVTSAGRRVLTKAVFNGDTTLYGDGTDGAVVSIKFDEQMEDSNGISMGGTVSSQCKIDIRQPSTPIPIVNSVFIPYVGLNDGTNQGYVPLGEFFATSADSNSNGGTVSIVGYDRFCKLEVPYEPTVSFPTTTTAIMADLATNRFTFSGTVTERTIDNFVVGTVKDWIGWLAGLEGKNARFNRDGELEFVYYDITQYDYTVGRENQYMSGVNTKTADNVTINAITSGTEENPIVSGSGRSITFTNPYMTQEILDDIRNSEIVDSITTVSGDLVSVTDVLDESPAKSVVVDIAPSQDLNGYDAPWVGGAGKNLSPLIDATTTGSGNLSLTQNGKYGENYVAGTTYTVSFDLLELNAGNFELRYNNSNVHRWNAGAFTTLGRKSYTYTPTADGYFNFWSANSAFTASAKVLDNVQVEVGSTATDYVPYENICPIYPANGENALVYPYSNGDSRVTAGITFTANSDGSISASGTATANADFYLVGANGVYEDAHIDSGDYRVTLGRQGGMPMGTYVRLYVVPYGGTAEYATDASSEEVTIDATATYRIFIRVSSGATVNATLYPMISSTFYGHISYAPYKGFSVTRTGKNVLPSQLINGTAVGVSYSLNADGSVTASGTSTSGSSGRDYLVNGYRPPNGTYILSGGNADVGVRINRYTKDGTLIDRNTSYATPLQIVIDDSVGYIYCGVGYVSANKSVDTTVYPQLELGDTATAYEPYQGEYYYSCDYNLWDEQWELGNISTSTGEKTSATDRIRSTNYIPVKPSTNYWFSIPAIQGSSTTYNRLFYYTSSKTYISYIEKNKNIGGFAFTTPADCQFISFRLPAEYGTTYKDDISINYSAPEQIGYGGTLDVSTGVLTVTNELLIMDGTSSNKKFTGKSSITGINEYYMTWSGISTLGYPASSYPTTEEMNNAHFLCNCAPVKYATSAMNETLARLSTGSSGYGQFRLRFASDFPVTITTYQEANTWLASMYTNGTPVVFCYPLATPQIYQLTPAQVSLLKGINNIWTESGTVSVTYLATPKANMSFRPMELQWRGNPCVQCGDRVYVEIDDTSSMTALVMAHTLTVEGGMNDVIKCFGSSDAEVALDKSPMEKKISTAYNALQSAIQDATALLNGTRGGIFEITKENDINTGWLIKESASPNYMGNVIVANYNGIGFSTDGGATYGTAITTDGHINGQYITAHSVDVEALSVGNANDPFSNYVYIGRRRPNDDTTDMVIRIGVATQSMVQEMRGNRTSIYKAEDVQAYVNGTLTDAQLDARALMYYSDTDYVLLNLGSFRIGGMLMQAQANGGVKFIKAE